MASEDEEMVEKEEEAELKEVGKGWKRENDEREVRGRLEWQAIGRGFGEGERMEIEDLVSHEWRK